MAHAAQDYGGADDSNNITATFLLCTDREPYDTWVVLQAASLIDVYEAEGNLHLLAIEIVHWRPLSADHMRGVEVLRRKMGDRFLCRGNHTKAPGAQKGRFLEIPQLKSRLTYIGDVDMFATRGHDFVRWHARNMLADRTCVSNMHRNWKTRDRLTGCMAVFTEPYFAYLSAFMSKDPAHNPVYRRTCSDEMMMTYIVNHMGPADGQVGKRIRNHGRILVGIHISPNRGDGKVMRHGHYTADGLATIRKLLAGPCMGGVLDQDGEARDFVHAIVRDTERHVCCG